MATKNVTDENFETEVLKANKPTLVDFWAEWCNPCKQIGPILEEISDEMKEQVVIAKHNIDINKNWYISCDCEGDEKYLFDKDNIEYLSKCSHIALEFHEPWCGISYNDFVKNFEILLKDTHKGFRTYYEKKRNGLFSSMIFVQNNIYKDKGTNIQNIIEYLKFRPHTKEHYITKLF